MFNEAKATIFGKITKVETGGDTKRYMRLTIPVNRSGKDGNETVERTSWVQAVVFRPKLIETLQKLSIENRYVRIVAEIVIDTAELDGRKINQTSLVVDNLDLLDPKPES